MKANESKLQPILEGVKQYVVPLFQRSYSWKKKRWQTLWDDLLEIYDEDDNREHFIGAIVTMPIEMSPEGVNKFLLIDGQQRLTTFFLILAAMRDTAVNKDNILPEQIEDLYLINKWETGVNRFKLFPSQTDREIFSQIIERKTPSDVKNSVFTAYNFFKRKLNGKALNGKSLDLNRIHKILMQQFVIVSIVLNEDENPYLIFESLNAKGEPLTQADLVRNYILMRIKDADDQEVAYRDFWLPMQANLRNEQTNFIWRYLNKNGTFVRQNAIYEAIKKRLAKKDSGEVIDSLIVMHTYSEYYTCLINPDKEPKKILRKRLHRINTWEVKTAYPFLLNIYHDYANERITDVEFCKILDMLESFVIRRFFCRVPTNILNKLFIALYSSLDVENIIESLQAALLRQNWPNNIEFSQSFERFPIYSSGTKKCRHILESLEESLLENNEPVDMKYPKITIEHIMPQTLNEDWEQTLGTDTANTHALYLHTLGNLTLTGQNSSMGNLAFYKKGKTFAKSSFVLNKKLAKLAWWDAGKIKQRAHDLGQVAIELWQYPRIESIGQDRQYSVDDPTGYKPNNFTLFNKRHEVDTWLEMLLTVLRLLAQKHGAEFAPKALAIKINKRAYIVVSPDVLISPMKIEGSDLWVEANQSSKSILQLLNQTMELFGYNDDEFVASW